MKLPLTAIARHSLLCLWLIAGCVPTLQAQEQDPALIQALHQATRDIREQTTDLNSLVWLSAMSERLERHIRNPFYRVRLLKAVFAEAQRAGLDPQLVLAVIDVESTFNRHAKSSAGAQGLMQVMPFWKEVYGQQSDDLFNPLVSLRYGCTILRHYIDRYKNQHRALAAYNGSLGRSKYPNKVMARLRENWAFDNEAFGLQDDSELAKR
ncbi:MAG: transglycosylase SLT domain-containing protein [Gammaproteobacteria bacterium]|nr:transglycosylase SLT domain-containing protein [Gammaproteobacteria bacterium]